MAGLSSRISRAVAAAESLLICYPVTWALSLPFIRPGPFLIPGSHPPSSILIAIPETAEINYRIIRQLHWPKGGAFWIWNGIGNGIGIGGVADKAISPFQFNFHHSRGQRAIWFGLL